ncbi:alanyl-tRNA synthetase [Clostridium saccharoperbutylacetonicum]|uniref:Alanine--tRNA ligase n=1 Tax=Clostridium saccharoperbutylacetonicum N1-4(HMT) TaxID=931276 RepID=M1MSV8_9CLOT|nr:DHHA1 domain-containing protein [Clostridium saccharoperbutylacetonicum]AGF59213.1 alanyl-tRNA editing protein AlaX-L [Clostridium saccharoperbutylacetonicum N1-4(HMT)]NRT60000.1 alanyl-tRNA synthetase [Clostridium saccharoperbutylacetonicum]NSB23312.1 alanyl-tRNA synthetase [Clostridium saccharoperbutylacetonicum]NSB42682.1 alanyl-tRNA synthetase [Clostridium saccharoperbutylacetonicum]
MEKIYYDNQYLKEFTAEIVDIKEIDNKFHVILDKTAFFPGGGGQNCDLGSLENEKIIDVYEKDDIVYHVLEKKPIKIHKVKCMIDWNRRTDGMHQHLGQHVLSGAFFNLFNSNTFAIHLGSDISTVDIYGILSEEQVREAEKLANKIIGDAIPVESFVPTKAELKKLTLRRALPNTQEDIRVVKIGDFDINACCGLHPASTLDLRLIKIKRFEKHKDGTRIEFLAGERAVSDSFKKDEFQNSICRYLSCNESEAINGIKNLNESLRTTNEMNKSLNILLAKYQEKEMLEDAAKLNDIRVIKKIFVGENLKYVSNLTSKLIENERTIALMAVQSEEKVNLIFACSKDIKEVKMNDLLKDAISLIDGKGGGSPFQAQGAGKNNANLESTLDYAFNKIAQSI